MPLTWESDRRKRWFINKPIHRISDGGKRYKESKSGWHRVASDFLRTIFFHLNATELNGGWREFSFTLTGTFSPFLYQTKTPRISSAPAPPPKAFSNPWPSFNSPSVHSTVFESLLCAGHWPRHRGYTESFCPHSRNILEERKDRLIKQVFKVDYGVCHNRDRLRAPSS